MRKNLLKLKEKENHPINHHLLINKDVIHLQQILVIQVSMKKIYKLKQKIQNINQTEHSMLLNDLHILHFFYDFQTFI